MHNFRCSQPHPVLIPVATEMTSSWQPASNCFSSALLGSQLPPQGFPADPSKLDQWLLMCNLKCKGFKNRWGEHLTVKKKELWIKISSSSSLWAVLEGVSFWAIRFLNKNSISQPFLTLSLHLCFTLLVPHFSSLKVKSLIKEELTIFASDSYSRKCKLKYPEKINKFQQGTTSTKVRVLRAQNLIWLDKEYEG